ncbi:hypothetical protein Goklo_024295, partial [Gossypium klotzschianum]|nr:hypothetical protein [Gossypium klotzschianum]
GRPPTSDIRASLIFVEQTVQRWQQQCFKLRSLMEVLMEKTSSTLWKRLETLYATKSLAKHLVLKQRLFTFCMNECELLKDHISQFITLLNYLKNVEVQIDDEDQAMLLLCFLPPSYKSFRETLSYSRDKLSFEDVKGHLLSRDKLKNEFGSDSKRLLTNAERVRRGLAEDPSCPIYGHSSKDISHIIRDYTLAKEVWKQNRNLFIFQGKSWSLEEMIKTSASWAKHFSLASRQAVDIEMKMTCGEPLAGEWTYLNTDGAVRVDSGDAAYLGNCSILDAELWGILDGLKLIQRRGDAKVVIQSDSLEAVKAIHGSALKTSHSTLIRRIHLILSQESNWLLHYIPSQQNQSADLIAKLAFGEKEDLQ